MWKKAILAGTFFAATAVMIGAFGAHGLQKYVEAGTVTAKQLADYETAARYQMYHAFALILLGIIAKVTTETRHIRIAFWLFFIGILLFSGSLYLITIKTAVGFGELHWLWPFTPLGGLCLIAGWLMLFLHIMRQRAERNTNL